MAEQLESLIEVMGHPKVSIRVLPFEIGLHPGHHCGPFVLMQFPITDRGQRLEPTTVYKEGLTGALYLDKPREAARHEEAFNAIWTLTSTESRSMGFLHEAKRRFEQ